MEDWRVAVQLNVNCC